MCIKPLKDFHIILRKPFLLIILMGMKLLKIYVTVCTYYMKGKTAQVQHAESTRDLNVYKNEKLVQCNKNSSKNINLHDPS